MGLKHLLLAACAFTFFGCFDNGDENVCKERSGDYYVFSPRRGAVCSDRHVEVPDLRALAVPDGCNGTVGKQEDAKEKGYTVTWTYDCADGRHAGDVRLNPDGILGLGVADELPINIEAIR